MSDARFLYEVGRMSVSKNLASSSDVTSLPSAATL
jgi:hypothetical protein